MTNTNDTVGRLRALANALALGEWIALTETCATAADEIERLRAERDEARMKLCERDAAERTKSAWSSGLSMRYLWQDIARERGWDCFKEKP